MNEYLVLANQAILKISEIVNQMFLLVQQEQISEETFDIKDFKETATKEKVTFVDAAYTILKENNEPLHASDICREMIKRGYPREYTPKFSNSMFTTLSRRPDKFKKVGMGLWEVNIS